VSIASNIQAVQQTIPSTVKLVAVSKYHPIEVVAEAYEEGLRVFGESKAQEVVTKYEALPKDIEWHFIGHLQTNKVKYIAPFIHTIQSVDSFKVLQEINKQAAQHNRVIQVMLQIHIASEETKFGLMPQECKTLLESNEFASLQHIAVCGLMGMATNTADEAQVADEFTALKALFDQIKTAHFQNDANFKSLSMGMSDDYLLAIAKGSTVVRVGSRLFSCSTN
jgi:hypothetical protein